MHPPTGTFVSVWRVRRWTRMFRMTSFFATGPEILLWWVGNFTPTLTTRPIFLVGALTVRLRWAPLMRFEALLGLFQMSRSCRPAFLVGTASALYSDSVYLWAFVAFLRAELGVFRGLSFTPLPLLVAFTPACSS